MQYEDIIFKDDDVIFHGEDQSTHAFYISKGNVELFRMGKIIYTAGVGEFIGQSGVISGKKYGLTAKAVGQTRIQKIEKNEFLSLMQDDPVVAATVVKNMSAQIYNNKKIKKIKPQSNDLTADINKLVDDFNYHKGAVKVQASPGRDLVLSADYDSKSLVAITPNIIEMSAAKKSFVSFLTSFVTGVGSSLIDENPIKILIPAIENDVRNMYQKWIMSVIEPLAKIKIIKEKEMLSVEDEHNSFRKSYEMISKYNCDLAIWGGIDIDGKLLTLKFSSSIPASDFMGNAPKNTLYIPLVGGDSLYSLLRALVLSSINPKDDEHQEILQDLLPIAISEAQDNMVTTVDLSNTERISNMVCLGNCAYSLANSSGRDDFYRKAKDIYKDSLSQVSPQDDRNNFILQRQLGQISQNISDKISVDPKDIPMKISIINEAIEHFNTALERTTKDANPLAWAELEYTVAGAYQQRASLEGNEEDFAKSIASYQSVLDVFSFDAFPIKWAEIMNSIGRTLQIYGEVFKDMDALKRSVKMYRQALMVRSKDMYPLLWAHTQNNLGSVLFLLARHVKDKETLQKAMDSFVLAKEVYSESGAVKMLTVVEKNIVRASDFNRELKRSRK